MIELKMYPFDTINSKRSIKWHGFVSRETREWLNCWTHNGSGKSTVVRLIDGLLEAESGEIYVDGKQLDSWNLWKSVVKLG